MKILVCITGASYAKIGLELLKLIPESHEIYAIISKNAKRVLSAENGISADTLDKITQNLSLKKGINFIKNSNISANVASGSFGIDSTVIAPCSINSLAKISAGISDSLILRAAAVALKERKRLILGVREMPFSAISLRQMHELSLLGAVVAPPILGGYSGENLDQIERLIIGKWLDLCGIKHEIYSRWQGKNLDEIYTDRIGEFSMQKQDKQSNNFNTQNLENNEIKLKKCSTNLSKKAQEKATKNSTIASKITKK